MEHLSAATHEPRSSSFAPPSAPTPISLVVSEEGHGKRLDQYLVQALAQAAAQDAGAEDLDVSAELGLDAIAEPEDDGEAEEAVAGTMVAAQELADNFCAPSRARIQAWLSGGHITVDGAPGKSSHRLHSGNVVRVAAPAPTPASVTAQPMELEILYEDSAILVLNKAANISVHPGAGEQRATLVNGLLAHCTDLSGIGGVLRPGIVHRLDRGTTGTLVVAKTDQAHRHLAAQFAARKVHKRYLALVHASAKAFTEARSGQFDTPYGRHRSDRKRFSGRFLAEGTVVRRAVTEWELVAQASGAGTGSGPGNLALVACTLQTGRTHQLRVHLAEHGLPIVGDSLYGQRRATGNAAAADVLLALDHQALHAWKLTFTHPVSGEALSFSAPLPLSWRALARQLLTRASNDGAQSTLETPCA